MAESSGNWDPAAPGWAAWKDELFCCSPPNENGCCCGGCCAGTIALLIVLKPVLNPLPKAPVEGDGAPNGVLVVAGAPPKLNPLAGWLAPPKGFAPVKVFDVGAPNGDAEGCCAPVDCPNVGILGFRCSGDDWGAPALGVLEKLNAGVCTGTKAYDSDMRGSCDPGETPWNETGMRQCCEFLENKRGPCVRLHVPMTPVSNRTGNSYQ